MKKYVELAAIALILAIVIAIPIDFTVNHPSLVANFVIAEIAHLKAGDPVPMQADYSYDMAGPVWGIMTNSQWLLDWTVKIVPSLVYEDVAVGGGNYPVLVIFIPQVGDNSFHVAGYAYPWDQQVFLNDRYVIDPAWSDAREALSTLVHELIHIQGGAYIFGPPEMYEANTQAATLEVLAGMCNQGQNLACHSFWYEIEGYSKVAFRQELGRLGWGVWYDRIADLIWRNAQDEAQAEKATRYWAGNLADLDYVYEAYYLNPWGMILQGLAGSTLDTRLLDPSDFYSKPTFMSYDDTQYILRYLGFLTRWAQ